MSRRGRHGHHAHSHAPGRPVHHVPPPAERPAAPPGGTVAKGPEPGVAAAIARQAVAAAPAQAAPPAHPAPPAQPAPPESAPERPPAQPAVEVDAIEASTADVRVADRNQVDTGGNGPISDARIPVMDAGPGGPRTTCTSAQLRRFIKSRPWVPLHELRRRIRNLGR